MTLILDVRSAPRHPEELRALVCAVEKAAAEDEADWIEWKSRLDLANKAVRALLARHIIGMANRRVEEARRFVEGFGFILVGVEPGNRDGVQRVDLADLGAGIGTYLEPNGPRWIAAYDTDPANDRSVLIITVDPPQYGDPVHMLHREFDRYRAGDIFVRKLARTERHTPSDLEYLIKRATPRGPTLDLDVHVTQSRAPLRPLVGFDDSLEQWLSDQRKRLLSSLEEPPLGPAHPEEFLEIRREYGHDDIADLRAKSRSGATLTDLEAVALGLIARSGSGPLNFRVEAESRSIDEYVNQVDTYLANCRNELMIDVHTSYLHHVGAAFTVKIENLAEQNLANVEVVLELTSTPAASRLLPYAEQRGHRGARLNCNWSEPPPPFGPKAEIAGFRSWPPKTNPLWRGPVEYEPHSFLLTHPLIAIDNLRPRARYSESLHIIVAEPVRSEISVPWLATATNIDGRLRGEFTLHVNGPPVAADELLAQRLSSLPSYMSWPWGYESPAWTLEDTYEHGSSSNERQ